MAQKRAKKATARTKAKKKSARTPAAKKGVRKRAARKTAKSAARKNAAKKSAKKTPKTAAKKTTKNVGARKSGARTKATGAKSKASKPKPKKTAPKRTAKSYELKTKETAVSVDGFLSTVDNPKRVEQARIAIDLLKRVTGEEPKMWGPSIVGFGRYSYVYDSGHSGEMCMVGFSPRKAQFVFYMLGHPPETDEIWSRLGKFKLGGSCLYVNKFEDVDLGVIEEIATRSIAHMKAKYPAMAA